MRTCSYLLGGLLLAGCGGSTSPSTPAPDETLSSGLSFEQFKATVYQEPDTGIYIVEGDIPVVGEARLREYHAQNIQAGALLINRSGGADTAWSVPQTLNLTYCVSTLFSDHAKVVEAMQRAAIVWESEAHVAFIHDGSQDNNCTNTNNNVLFDVRPGPSNAPYDARAFFPNESRSNRNLYIKPNQVPARDAVSLGRVLAHELGHVLGFRHEHTRVSGACFEDSNWRAITPYDTTSIMHYSTCPGYTGTGLILSNWDAWGATDTYKRGPLTVAGDFDGNGLDDVLTYRPGSG